MYTVGSLIGYTMYKITSDWIAHELVSVSSPLTVVAALHFMFTCNMKHIWSTVQQRRTICYKVAG